MNPSCYFTISITLQLLGASAVLAIPIADINGAEGVLVRTAPWGTNVILRCGSNDGTHNFFYWHLINKGVIIGPANKYDISKFRYEILSGNLMIKGISTQEEGLYECVSRAVIGDGLNIRVVRMVVQNDRTEFNDHDYNITMIRILLALITLVLLSMGAWFVYVIWKDRYRYPHYLNNDDDDDSTEELFSQPSTSKGHSVKNIVPVKPRSIVKEPNFDDVDISTDFRSILDTANDE
ncbi:uncharacterized protein [Euwallacea fornicatus]|uniref:uncharacterized protein isoform X2 n=1 Tax=Euwallacea fornicatus TaxID=995702 RepID=UPI00338FDD97